MQVVDPEIAEFARSFRTLANGCTGGCPRTSTSCPRSAGTCSTSSASRCNEVEPVSETFPPHQVVDLDLALEALLTEYARGAARDRRAVTATTWTPSATS